MTLTNPTYDQLNAAFADRVAGWTVKPLMSDPLGLFISPDGKHWQAAGLPFTRSADAVLPWLEKHHWNCQSHGMSGSTHGYPHCTVTVTEFPVAEHPERFGLQHEGHCFFGDSIATALPYAAVIALLRSHGVEVEFTQ